MKEISFPFILINFKTYAEALGSRGLRIARVAKRVSEDTGISIGVAPQYVDIRDIARLDIPVFAQHVDPIRPGSHTGHVLLEAVVDAGAVGIILNHSERRLKLADINWIIRRAKRLGLISIVCADTVETAVSAAMLEPNMVAIEPPELIGTGRAVSKYSPESIVRAAEIIGNIKPNVAVLCGAGISSGGDVEAALGLGAKGVLLASAVAKAHDPEAVLRELAESARKFIGKV